MTLDATNAKIQEYAHPDYIVSTEWLSQNLNDPSIRIIESNEDILLYSIGHIPGAVQIDWRKDLQDDCIRDYITKEKFAALCEKNGITPQTRCIFYGDKSNWWACYALWAFKLFGHHNVAILDGGRNKWLDDKRVITKEIPQFDHSVYLVPDARLDDEIRAFYDETLAHALDMKPLVDVRSLGEFKGEVTHMPDYPQEGVLRGGHIPNATHCPWGRAANPDGTFKTRQELSALYEKELELSKDEETIVYCRIGERSSHTWFVLTYLLDFKHVRNYDGSWTEWGNRVRSPIEKSI